MKYDDTDIPARYDESRKLPDETIALWINAISEHIPLLDLKLIVDLGCGTGRFLNALIKNSNACVYGIDPSIKMINKARETIVSPNLSFAQSTAEDLCVASNSVDMVFISQSYHHFNDKNKAISEIKRVLKTNGFLCIRNSTVENLNTCFHLRFFPGAYRDDQTYLPTKTELLDQLSGHQFKIISARTINYRVSESLEKCYKKVELRTFTDLVQLPDAEFQEGLEAFKLYLKTHDVNEPVFEEMDLFIYRKESLGSGLAK